jgi:hypothetical protein
MYSGIIDSNYIIAVKIAENKIDGADVNTSSALTPPVSHTLPACPLYVVLLCRAAQTAAVAILGFAYPETHPLQ